MPGGSFKTRECLLREVRSIVLARDIGAFAGAVQTADVTGWITGGHSLLRFGIYVAFFPTSAPPVAADFVGNLFKIYGWISDANGKFARASETPINGATGTNAPDGWEGCASLSSYEVVATVDTTHKEGEWRLVVVCEPAEGCSCEQFDELVQRVTVRVEGEVTVISAPA